MKISVLTPCCNGDKYLERAIQSVLDQNDPDFEHVIVDGGSADGTVEILKKYDHLKWISEKDDGQSDAMNKAFHLSSGEIIVYLNTDDYFFPGVFSLIRREITQGVDIVVGNILVEYTEKKSYVNIPFIDVKKILYPSKYPFPYNPVGYFYRREVQQSIGAFPLDNHLAMDYWFLLRAFASFKVSKVDAVFGSFFNDGNNKTSATLKDNCFPVALRFCRENRKMYLPVFLINYSLGRMRTFILAPRKELRKIIYNLIFSKKYTVADFQERGLKELFKSFIRRDQK